MAKKFDPKAKAKRDKIIAAVAGVIFLGVLAFSVPKTMAMLNQGNAATETPPATPAAPGEVPLAPPTLGGTTATPSSSNAAPVTSYSQLVSFDRFRSKDPFQQQVSEDGGDSVPGAPSGPGATQPAPGAGGVVPPGQPGSTTPGTPTPATRTTSAPRPAPTAATISVNGAPAETVLLTQEFPRPPAEPMFRLVALTYKSAKISIVGGSYASGAATVTVKKSKPLTLVNTADGTRYEIRLVWIGVGAPPATATTTTAATAGPPPAAPASTTTTPTTP